MSFTDYTEDALLNHFMGKATFTPNGTYNIALYTAAPNDDGTGGAEVSGGGYARVATTASDWNSSSGGSITNANAITFAQATASWGTINTVVLFDGTSMAGVGALSASKTISSGEILKFNADSLTITLS